MLKDVRIHLDMDDELQNAHEVRLASRIMSNLRRNEVSFKTFVPSLVSKVKQARSQNISVFANKFGQLNIVDYSKGRTFYGLQPSEEIKAQYRQKKAQCTYCRFEDVKESHTEDSVSLSSLNDLVVFQEHLKQPPLPKKIDVMVVLGIGLGEHVRLLIENHDIKHLIIYEPELQYFQCSVLAMDWNPLFSLAKKKGTGLYFQLENDGNTLIDDMDELTQSHSADGFFLYRHYNQNVFNCLEHGLLTENWSAFRKNGLASYLPKNKDHTLSPWTPPVSVADYNLLTNKESVFTNNIAAFEHYFADIAEQFKNYVPEYWLPVTDHDGTINIISRFSLNPWYSTHPFDDGKINLNNFASYPNKDGLVLGYEGKKLKDYTHFRFVKKAQKLLDKTEEEAGELPAVIKSLIMFGIGPQLSLLMDDYCVEKLFICEPNKDLFYASLFYVDWAAALKKIDDSKGRLYINVGDDGTNLFKDLISQFYSVGPYILASTYFYQTYHNEALVKTISQLREQLQVVIAMGENFDHARHGIAHTRETIKRQYPLLEKAPASKLTGIDKDVPVFIVGNGPSLDDAIAAIKEWQGAAIVVSCGTALMPLHRNGIVPDFHAEIEQNRSTFDWCSRIGDFDYLKKINLISCNGIHPDTCALFNDVFLAFKEGESSTVSTLTILGRENYEELQFAFPTVSNFVMNIITLIGFEQIYLFGVDLGFVDKTKHHSTQSGYYDAKGVEKYSYQTENNTDIVVPGNFEKYVYTKYEFKVSKIIIEQTLSQGNVDCFNTSNGAKIEGATPLPVDFILITSSPEQKHKTLQKIQQQVFKPVTSGDEFEQAFIRHFDDTVLADELTGFIEIVSRPFSSIEDVDTLTDKQKEMLFESYTRGNSLLFYYLYGTVNYANSLLSKLLLSLVTKSKLLTMLNELREVWAETLSEIKREVVNHPFQYDHVSSFSYEREEVFLKTKIPQLTVNCFLSEQETYKLNILARRRAKQIGLSICKTQEDDSAIVILPESAGKHSALNRKANGHCIVQLRQLPKQIESELLQQNGTTYLYTHPMLDLPAEASKYLDGEAVLFHDYMATTDLLKACFLADHGKLIIPKISYVSETDEVPEKIRQYALSLFDVLKAADQIINYPNYIVVPKKKYACAAQVKDDMGNRGQVLDTISNESVLFMGNTTKYEAQKQLDNYDKNWWKGAL
ncbi:6-hydroxymethylpterin diphosphokinase MptE-like protein [Alteromonas sp. C1M14]|uniref:motility associated factor glycosyltransferase family protein n=1 Tax=Alteromonas sp. C1M14 TaxID=2841567 RepID=UPI001C0847C7|nr:6-hydroxymethylpterin diphosphokinase MptE-like protein [Alteromonas sp. C1M14]MBU2977954.1 DUF115 domain-containing protein [Alteromonas sp. C1M14]